MERKGRQRGGEGSKNGGGWSLVMNTKTAQGMQNAPSCNLDQRRRACPPVCAVISKAPVVFVLLTTTLTPLTSSSRCWTTAASGL